jgi:hypothetical protein
MFDLRVNTKERNESYRWRQEQCVQIGSTENKVSHLLKYNGQTYDMPKHLKADEP